RPDAPALWPWRQAWLSRQPPWIFRRAWACRASARWRRQPGRGPVPRAQRAASLLRVALFQPVLEAAIEVGVDRQVVGEELRIDLLELGDALALLPAIDARRAARQDGERERRVERSRGPAAEAAEDVVGPCERGHPLRALARERRFARRQKPALDLGPQRSAVQLVADLFSELLLVHSVVGPAQSVIPRARSATANVCVAREQCVFTLPSEHCMRRAVSATSNSSQ